MAINNIISLRREVLHGVQFKVFIIKTCISDAINGRIHKYLSIQSIIQGDALLPLLFDVECVITEVYEHFRGI
jgi:hypothetical protein